MLTRLRGRMWAHANRPDDDVPMWRYGRAWLMLPGMGWRNRPYTELRRDIEAGVEWKILRRPSFGYGAAVKWGTASSEEEWRLTLNLGYLASVWLHLSGVWPRQWLVKGDTSRETEVNVGAFDGWENLRASVTLWGKRGEWHRDAPWWEQDHAVRLSTLFGRQRTEREVIEAGVCEVPLPEGVVSATYEIERVVASWPTRLGRLRPRRVWYRTEITPDTPVVVPGKGENSWDLGDSALEVIAVPGRSVTRAVAMLVESVLSDRQRYG